ncbi:MAG TPA: citramalate synthase [Kofleriaceae bacterium]|nr:citramalate synthase [Kofleriaceae bacterium]
MSAAQPEPSGAGASPAASPVAIYDTTLRDGTQREGISLACTDKLRIAQQLDALGVAFIEGGWPGSNPKDAEFFRRARDVAWMHAAIAAFGSTRRAGVPAADDPGLVALIDSDAPVCTLFGKSSVVHVTDVLRTSLDENLRMIEDSVAVLVAAGRRVVYDAEHFFDGARQDAGYAYETLRAAVRGGAEIVVLCDTNGGTLPWELAARVRDVIAAIGHPVGIHAHDDAGCGVASSLAAVTAGATHVQGTINGYGERCGNANLTSIIPCLELKLGRPCIRAGALAMLGRVSRFVAEIANLAFDEHAPYVGKSAFAHKGGVHVAAIRRSPRSYEHVDPALVGNRTRVVVSELSGRGNVLAKAEQYDVAIAPALAGAVLAQLKQREQRGCAFESAEASVALMMRRAEPGYRPPFELVDYKVLLGHRAGAGDAAGEPCADAVIKVRIGGEVLSAAAEGTGPVHAIDTALRKALAAAYPEIAAIQLEDYKVRILDGRAGTSAVTRVLIDHGDGREQWTTVGASPSILEASLTALIDGIEHGLALARAARAPHTAPKGHHEGHDRPLAG